MLECLLSTYSIPTVNGWGITNGFDIKHIAYEVIAIFNNWSLRNSLNLECCRCSHLHGC
ncbi:Uncharacterised protein [Segatella copri]|nr:Uncharacterised protein [Segatella copri]